MKNPTRRDFVALGTLSLAAAALPAQTPDAQTQTPDQPPTPGAPPAFGTAPAFGPEVSPATFTEAEKLVNVQMTPAGIAQAAGNWRVSMAPLYERRVGPRKVALGDTDAPATIWNPAIPGAPTGPAAVSDQKYIGKPSANQFARTADPHLPLPVSDTDIAFAPVHQLARWIESRQLTSERLTRIYIDRIQRFDPQLKCVITLTRDHALEQARRADTEIAAGHYRGPLHGIPWGAKDLLDTAGIPTTYGAEPFRNRVPAEDAAVTKRLNEAGAVLVAKLSMGALALNDIWFGGQTKNPWLLEEGSSGSSAGPGAATAAGLVAFAIGSETEGSIVSPTMRCGLTGLRPTFGRVPRTGAMTLCWSLDKLGPMARSVEDTMLVLKEIYGPDPGDLASVTAGPGGPVFRLPPWGGSVGDHLAALLEFNPVADLTGLRVGYFPAWMKEAPATDVDRAALETVKKLGMTPVEVSLPDWPYGDLSLILFAESAAAFEELTLSHAVDQLAAQVPDAWPNTFRQSRFLSAVDFVQADRFRRKVAQEMARVMSSVDLLLVPSLRDEMLTLTNFTGHPSLTLRAGFVEVSEPRSDWAPDPAHPLQKFATPRRVPHGVTLIGRLFDEGTIAQVGLALEQAFAVTAERPPQFS